MSLLSSPARGTRPARPGPAGRAPAPRTGRVPALLRLARPGQWAKNVLVFAAPAAAGQLESGPTLGRTLVLAAAFVAASVAVYALNDVLDAPLDRRHPRKRTRPVAAGAIRPRTALLLSAGAAGAGLAAAAALGLGALATLAGYLLISALYTLKLKHTPVLDVLAVSTGFVLRALSGAAANHLVVSNWFLLVSLFGALYLVTGKRNAEATAEARPVLSAYPQAWLQQVMTMALTGTVISYAMWAFQYLGTEVVHPLLAASVAPFLVVMLRYGLLLAQGGGERPERLLFRDRVMILTGLVWAALVGGGIYLL
jgi:decaprenyl-phosphate phosphoribosyltransferase